MKPLPLQLTTWQATFKHMKNVARRGAGRVLKTLKYFCKSSFLCPLKLGITNYNAKFPCLMGLPV